MNKTDLRSMLAKLHEIEQGPAEPVNEAVPNVFNFLKGLGAGSSKAKPRIEPTGLAQGADELVTAAVQNADKKLSQIRRVTPAELVAAKAEGITIDELLMRKFPDTFAKLEKNPELKAKVATEFSKAADEIMVAIERGEDPRALWPKEASTFDKKSLAMSAMGHALLALGLLISNKQSGGSSSTSAIPADQVPWKTYLGMDPRPYDSLQRGNNPSRPWVIVSPAGVAVGKIDDPKLVQQIEKLAAMSPEERKKLAQAEPKTIEIPVWSQDDLNKMSGAQQPTVKELPKAPEAGATPTTSAPEKDADIGIAKKKKKSKEEEEAERKKKEAAAAAKKAEEDKKRKILPTLTF
jgi:hypothetical protein